MADIELVIKIPEEIRLALINNIQLSLDQQSICDSYIKRAVIKGTPLPKGHGDLKDADEIKKNQFTLGTSNYCEYKVVTIETIDKADAIIKADTEEREDDKK